VRPIDYPNPALDLALQGKPAAWQRRLLLRPLRTGDYSVLAWPEGQPQLRYLQRADVTFPDAGPAPQAVLLTVPRHLRGDRDWRWRLVRWETRRRDARAPDLSRPRGPAGEWLMQPAGHAGYGPRREWPGPPNSALLFELRATLEGRLAMAHDQGHEPHRLAMWSCNQPYVTDEFGAAALNPDMPGLLEWAAGCIRGFDPHAIWALGDTAYADGTDATNFVDQFYDHPGALADETGRAELRAAYRRMYRHHWSFPPLLALMRDHPHLCVWDDHEIRDGWGSEDQDLAGDNPAVFDAAREAAGEYILNSGPRVRPPARSGRDESDAHQSYIAGEVAAFIFDGRSSRRYSDPGGRVVSDQQLADFASFCDQVADERDVRYLVMGCGVPFINLKDFVETLGSAAPKVLTDLMAGVRDDIRDSWLSKGNREAFRELLGVLRRLHRRRPSLDIVNLSGDIHVANAFSFQPPGFAKCLYQFTSSALTNRDHPPALLAALIDVGRTSMSGTLGLVTRIWESLGDPNVMTVEPHGGYLRISLRVWDLDSPPAERGAGTKDLVFDVGSETFGLRRMLAG
jgi:hypothetical protein